MFKSGYRVFYSKIMLYRGHYNLVNRIKKLVELFEENKEKVELINIEDKERTLIDFTNVHSETYIKYLENLSGLDMNPIWDATYQNTLATYYAALDLVNRNNQVQLQEFNLNFVLHSDGGHHAGVNNGWGMCYLNHICLTASNLKKLYPELKILIIDTDYHHADGTFDIIQSFPDITVFCIHSEGAEKQDSSNSMNLYDVVIPNDIQPEEYLKILYDQYEIFKGKGLDFDLVLYDFGYDIYRLDYGGLENFSIQDTAKVALEVIKIFSKITRYGISLNLTGGSDPQNAYKVYNEILTNL